MAKQRERKPLFWLSDGIKTPPFSVEARVEAGSLLRLVQEGELIGLPLSRPMPDIGVGCHELRIRDENRIWRVVCKGRFRAYDAEKQQRKGARG
jgi:phage-related protein